MQLVQGVKRVAYYLSKLHCQYHQYYPMKVDIWQNRTMARQVFGMHKVNMHTPFKFDYF